MADFTVDPDTLHGLVEDKESAQRNYMSLGGSPASLARLLKTDITRGREDSAAVEKARAEKYGRNALPPPDDVSFFELMWDAFQDPMMRLLCASAIVSLILGLTVADPHTGRVDYDHGWIEGTAILVSVLIVTTVSSVNDYQKEQKFKELSKAAPPTKVQVLKNSVPFETTEDQVMVGDVLLIHGGMICPADGVLVKGVGLKMDESATTGENDEIEKAADGDVFFRSGTNVLEGEGAILVTAVGEKSLAGRIAMAVREEKADTPLQEKLTELADFIGYMGMGAAGLMFVVLCIKELVNVYYFKTGPLVYKKFLDMITTAVTIVVVAVPEGLPLSVTIALAYSMKQMMHENNLVRHLAACETMGGATSICTDKTGTLTQNEMTVMRGFLGSRKFELIGEKQHDADVLKAQVESHSTRSYVELVSESISLNSTASKKSVQTGPGQFQSKYLGNKTESAMLQFVEKLGETPAAIRAKHDQKNVHRYPFTSAKKSMTTCVRLPGGVMRFHVKGASEIVLAACTKRNNGTDVEPMTEFKRGEIADAINEFARNRLRTLVLAYADVRGKTEFDQREKDWPELVFLGLLGIEDPIRPEVEEAVGRCKAAGVAVRMVTGDNKCTAIAIAKKAGIYGQVYWGKAKGEEGLAMEGKYFRQLAKSERRLNVILPRLQVLARASPLDKQILVASLMKRGEVVAVTGDGTNDAPALKKADVGFAMATGTDVAKNASDVVILDDNFRSIVTAMKWGRNVNDNICKFVQFQSTVNVAAVFIAFVGAVMSGSGESPLKPVQLLWLNLIMDTMAALALATERPVDALLDRPPRSKDAPLITRRMWVNILGQAAYQIGLQLWLLNGGHRWFGVKENSEAHLTIVFNVFVLLQVVNEFNARHLGRGVINVFSGLQRAPLFVLIIVITVVVQVLGVNVLGKFMKCVPLSRKHWIQCIQVSIMPLPIGIFLRMLPVTEVVVPIGEDVEPEDEAAEAEAEAEIGGNTHIEHSASLRGKRRFKYAAQRVITQLKVAGALEAGLR